MSQKKTVKTVLSIVMLLLICTAAFAAETENPEVLTVGSTTMTSDDVMRLITSTAGGNEMLAMLMLSQATVQERLDLVNQMSDAIIFAEAAKHEGLDTRKDVAFQIKWHTIQILVQAYMDKISATWDMSDKAARAYYDSHKEEFVEAPAAKARQIMTDKENAAMDAMMELYRGKSFEEVAGEYSRDPNTFDNGGDLGWVEKGTMTEAVDKVLSEAPIGQVMQPVQSDYGWHIIKVEERRPERQMPYEEAYQEVVQRLQRHYIKEEIKSLKQKYEVKVNEEALENIGGVPAAPEESK